MLPFGSVMHAADSPQLSMQAEAPMQPNMWVLQALQRTTCGVESNLAGIIGSKGCLSIPARDSQGMHSKALQWVPELRDSRGVMRIRVALVQLAQGSFGGPEAYCQAPAPRQGAHLQTHPMAFKIDLPGKL